jgi:hypothetical protein
MNSRTIVIVVLVCSLRVSAQTRGDSAVVNSDSTNLGRSFGRVSISSIPLGAEVFDGSQKIGTTPIGNALLVEGLHHLRFYYPSSVSWNSVCKVESLMVLRGTHGQVEANVGNDSPIPFMKAETTAAETNTDLPLNTSAATNTKTWIGYAAGATMILSGMLSAYLKDQANAEFQTYLQTNDPASLSTTHSLDRQAGATLVVSEISLGVLIYLLLSD